jgi:hypothetical protein
MATAYKYVEREAENQINWAEVGSNFSNMLNEEARVREEKKAAIDEATREYQKVVANVPVGEDGELNKVALAFADDLQQQMLMQETLLKSGQLKPSQYTLMRQNLVDGTDIGFSLYQEYNEEFSKKMALNNDNIPYGERLSKVTLEMMENVEGFSNFKGARLVIDSATGNVAAAKMIKDPNNPDGPLIPDSNPANLMSVSNLRNRIRTTVTNFDVVGAAKNWTKNLKPDVREAITSMGTGYKAGTIEKISTYVRKAGGLDGLTDEQIAKKAEELGVSVDDLKSISLFEEASDKWAKSQLQGGTYNGASVLLDFNKFTMDGELYSTTYNPDDLLDENGNRKQNILFAKTENGRVVYELTEEQEANAERALKTQARMMLQEEGTVRAQQMKTAYKSDSSSISRSIKAKQDKDALNKFQYFLTGNDSQIEEAKTYFKSLYPNLKDIIISNDEVQFTYSDRDPATIKRKGQSVSQFVQGVNYALSEKNQIVGVDNITRSIKGYDPTDAYRDIDQKVYKDDKADIAIKEVADNFKVDRNNPVSSIQSFIATIDGLKDYIVEGPTDDFFSDETIAIFGPEKTVVLQFDPEDYDGMEEAIRKLYRDNATTKDKNKALIQSY